MAIVSFTQSTLFTRSFSRHTRTHFLAEENREAKLTPTDNTEMVTTDMKQILSKLSSSVNDNVITKFKH